MNRLQRILAIGSLAAIPILGFGYMAYDLCKFRRNIQQTYSDYSSVKSLNGMVKRNSERQRVFLEEMIEYERQFEVRSKKIAEHMESMKANIEYMKSMNSDLRRMRESLEASSQVEGEKR